MMAVEGQMQKDQTGGNVLNLDNLDGIPDWEKVNPFKYRDGESWENSEREKRAKALYNQAKQLYTYTSGFCETLKGEHAEITKDLIQQNIMRICPKILGAESGFLYIIKMENASIIRTNAKELETQIRAAHLFGICTKADKEIVLAEIEKLRKLFIEWVAHFEKDDIKDDWGLY